MKLNLTQEKTKILKKIEQYIALVFITYLDYNVCIEENLI